MMGKNFDEQIDINEDIFGAFNGTQPEPAEKQKPELKKMSETKKTYLKLDTTGLDLYLTKVTIDLSQQNYQKVSKTAYIRQLIQEDAEKRGYDI